MEWLVFVGFDKRNGFIAQPIGQVLFHRFVGDGAVFVRIEPLFGLPVGASADVAVKAVVLGVIPAVDHPVLGVGGPFTGEVPLAQKSRRVALLF